MTDTERQAVRRAALEEAANEGRMLIPCDDRYDAGVRALVKRIRALADKPAEPERCSSCRGLLERPTFCSECDR